MEEYAVPSSTFEFKEFKLEDQKIENTNIESFNIQDIKTDNFFSKIDDKQIDFDMQKQEVTIEAVEENF
jgi:hypothetical protein